MQEEVITDSVALLAGVNARESHSKQGDWWERTQNQAERTGIPSQDLSFVATQHVGLTQGQRCHWRDSVSPEHYLRPEGEQESDPPIPRAGAFSRMSHRLAGFLFNKEPDRTSPEIFPNSGFNSNGRRHS